MLLRSRGCIGLVHESTQALRPDACGQVTRDACADQQCQVQSTGGLLEHEAPPNMSVLPCAIHLVSRLHALWHLYPLKGRHAPQ